MKTKKITVGNRDFVISNFSAIEVARLTEISKAIRSGKPYLEFTRELIDIAFSSLKRADASIDRAAVEQLELGELFHVLTQVFDFMSAELPKQLVN